MVVCLAREDLYFGALWWERKVIGHQWYWSYECSDFEVAPKVAGENLELIEKVLEI